MIHIKFNLSCPVVLGEQVAEYLLTSDELTNGFTTTTAHSHGKDFALASPREEVRGQVETLHIFAILPQERLGSLLDGLRARFRNPHMTYWTEPVQTLGDFT